MKILILSQWCEPEPTFKGLIFAGALKKRGHEVEILTGFPNYPGGKLYEGYRVKLYRRDVVDDIVVHRVPVYPSHDRSTARRIANYASFALSATVLGPIAVKKPDVIYAYHPPPTVGFVAIILKRLFKAPLVYDIQDMWPDTVRVSGMLTNERALGIIDRYCHLIYREANRIVVQSHGFKRLLKERKVPEEKITVIYNWTHEIGLPVKSDPKIAAKLGFEGRFNVLFAGTMGTAQALDTVLEAAKLIALCKPEVQFLFVGGGVDRERLERRAADEKIFNVRFLPRQEPAAMGPILAAADALLVHLRDDPLFRITIPSKTQAYMAAGKPILMGVRGDAAALVEAAGCGFIFPPQDSEALAEAIERLSEMPAESCEEMGRSGLRYYNDKMSLLAGCDAFEHVFRAIVKTVEKGSPDNSIRTGRPSLFFPASSRSRPVQRLLKRGIDLAIAGSVLVAVSPILGGTALALYVNMGTPILFRQIRPGRNEKPFTIFKFRTMKPATSDEQWFRTDDHRLTRLGRFLRKTSIDELPELFNVLIGDMSLVGPRPLLTEYLEKYTPEERRRHEVKPGITGWAQVNGRQNIPFSKRLELDVWYVDNWNLLLDIEILLMTIASVFRSIGVISGQNVDEVDDIGLSPDRVRVTQKRENKI